MKKSGLKVKQYTKKSPVKSVTKSSKKINYKKKQSLKNIHIRRDGFEIYRDPPSSPRKKSKKKKTNRPPLKNITNIRRDGFEVYHDPPSPKKKSVKKTKKKRQPLKNITNTHRNDGKKRRSKSPLKLRK
jgi:hypothetical protein